MNTVLTIDEDRLLNLEADFGADGLEIVIEAYLEESAEIVDALGDLLTDQPDQRRVEHFHFLRGAAHNVGAQHFGDLCGQLENQNGPFSSEAYAKFREEYQAVKGYFFKRFNQSAA